MTRAADFYKDAGNRSKACSLIIRGCRSLSENESNRAENSLKQLVDKLVVFCEDEEFPSCLDYLDKAINILVREDNFEHAVEVLRRASVLLKDENDNRMKWRNLLSEIVLLLKLKKRSEAREVLKTADDGFLESKEYAFGCKLVNAFENLDIEELKILMGKDNNWIMMHSAVARVGKKLSFNGLDAISLKAPCNEPDVDDFR